MQSLNRKNKGIKYLLCAIDKMIKQSNRKPNKIWVDQGSEFFNRDFKK